MGRANYKTLKVLGNKGINQQEDLADPKYELADARNVWAPNGKIEQRPGYWTVTTLQISGDATMEDIFGLGGADKIYVEDPIGTLTDVSGTKLLNSLGVGKRFYVGFPIAYVNSFTSQELADGDTFLQRSSGVCLGIGNANSNSCYLIVEYPFKTYEITNGASAWAGLPSIELNDSNGYVATTALGVATTSTDYGGYRLAMPTNWVASFPPILGNSVAARYWLRFTVQGINGATSLDSSTALTFGLFPADLRVSGSTTAFNAGSFVVQFAATKRYITRFVYPESNETVFNLGALTGPNDASEKVSTALVGTTTFNDLASIAVIPQFDECFVAYDYKTTLHKAYPTTTDTYLATVEDDNDFVGTGKYFDKNVVQQLNSWPEAKYITFFQGQLWCANLKDDPQGFRWSGPAPYHKVWPLINYEQLSENDNSPITGMFGYDQNMTIFKNDSIWKIVYAGAGPQNLGEYVAEPIVRGVGCVSNSSIAEVQGRLVFLGEDGIYMYDGTPNIKKLSDPINKYLQKLNVGARKYTVGVNWKSQSCYLLACRTQNSNRNNLVICWDYKNNAWWVWDSLEVNAWLLDEGSDDLDKLYFMDNFGRVFEFNIGNTDNGATIESYIETQRLGTKDGLSTVLRSVDVYGNNLAQLVTAEICADDESAGTSGDVDFKHADEKLWYNNKFSGTDYTYYNTDLYTFDRRRTGRLMFRKKGQHFKVKLTHDTANTPMSISAIDVGIVRLGAR